MTVRPSDWDLEERETCASCKCQELDVEGPPQPLDGPKKIETEVTSSTRMPEMTRRRR